MYLIKTHSLSLQNKAVDDNFVINSLKRKECAIIERISLGSKKTN